MFSPSIRMGLYCRLLSLLYFFRRHFSPVLLYLYLCLYLYTIYIPVILYFYHRTYMYLCTFVFRCAEVGWRRLPKQRVFFDVARGKPSLLIHSAVIPGIVAINFAVIRSTEVTDRHKKTSRRLLLQIQAQGGWVSYPRAV